MCPLRTLSRYQLVDRQTGLEVNVPEDQKILELESGL